MNYIDVECKTGLFRDVSFIRINGSSSFVQGMYYGICHFIDIHHNTYLSSNSWSISELILPRCGELLDYSEPNNAYNQNFWNIVYSTGIKHYQYYVLITFDKTTKFIRFDDIDILNGLITFSSWLSEDSRSKFIIHSVHQTYKLCRTYINYDVKKPGYIQTRKLLDDHAIPDVVNIIVEYSMQICGRSYNGYTTDPIYCETICDEGNDTCEVCSGKLIRPQTKTRTVIIQD